eukprot:364870-Chlamydomonas_euryale.AAC.8
MADEAAAAAVATAAYEKNWNCCLVMRYHACACPKTAKALWALARYIQQLACQRQPPKEGELRSGCDGSGGDGTGCRVGREPRVCCYGSGCQSPLRVFHCAFCLNLPVQHTDGVQERTSWHVRHRLRGPCHGVAEAWRGKGVTFTR